MARKKFDPDHDHPGFDKNFQKMDEMDDVTEQQYQNPDAIQLLEQKGFTIEKLNKMWNDTIPYYDPELRRMQLLDAVDKGRLWQALNVKMPDYQLLPDTNFISKTKIGLLASIYSVTKSAQIMPTSQSDRELITNLNTFLGLEWSRNNIGYYQFRAGERCALMNIGITQVGWKHGILGGSGDLSYTGEVSLKNINPMKFRRDPFAVDLDTSSFCLTYDTFHESLFEGSELYRDSYARYKTSERFTNQAAVTLGLQQLGQAPYSNAQDYHVLFTFFVRDGRDIHEIHVIDLAYILVAKVDIHPKMYPFAIAYCNEPAEDLIGTSECAKIFGNNVVYNLMDSILYTAEYKNQRPPKFVNAQSQINLPTFMKHGTEADRTFIVMGDATKAVHYHEFPKPSTTMPMSQRVMAENMGVVTGVDDRYMGRDTGSVLTTGGIEDMLSRVTLIDAPKILLYENYAKQLTKLVVHNYLEYGKHREMYYQDPRSKKWKTVTVDLQDIDPNTILNYEIDISSELPHNKQRVEALAMQLMEKQLQYNQTGQQVQWITPEELLSFIDLGPMQEYLLDRMGIQRMSNALEKVAATITTYTNLVGSGFNPQEALNQTAAIMDQRERGIPMDKIEPAENYTPQPNQVGMSPKL